ncbi:hypothetical protein BRAS3843_2120018 [Bradyrhizobium sp. STM 3843]|nr:hypothetical protein BRAS3843_2120018 [Bradyrhizobium sp. STM 3843]
MVLTPTHKHDRAAELNHPCTYEVLALARVVYYVVLNSDHTELNSLLAHKCYFPSRHESLLAAGAVLGGIHQDIAHAAGRRRG